MPKATHPMVTIEHVGRIRNNLNSTLAGEWGLSLHLESRNAGATGQYLLDFGYTPEVLVRNFSLLGIEPEQLNGLILSHGHRDHYGGLPGFVAHYRDRMRDDLRLFAGGKENFREKWVGSRDEEPASWGALDRAALEASELVPQSGVIALLVNPNNPNAGPLIRYAQEAVHAKGVQLAVLKAGTEGEIDAAFASLVQLRAGALVVDPDGFFTSRREQLVALASRHVVPAIYAHRQFVAGGGLTHLSIAELAFTPDGCLRAPSRPICRSSSRPPSSWSSI
jgi:hypothetical protein